MYDKLVSPLPLRKLGLSNLCTFGLLRHSHVPVPPPWHSNFSLMYICKLARPAVNRLRVRLEYDLGWPA